MKASDPRVKQIYLAEGLSLRETAKKTGCSPNYLMQLAAKEGWDDTRQQLLRKTEAKAIEKISNRNSNTIADMNTRHLSDSTALQNICKSLLLKVANHFKDGSYDNNAEALAAFRAAATSLMEAQKLERLIYGEPTERSETNASVSLTDREYSRFSEILSAIPGSS